MRARVLTPALSAGLWLACAAGVARAASGSASALFIGNSLTGTTTLATGQNMPKVLAQLAASRGKSLVYKEAYDFGHTLLESWQANIPEPYLTGDTQYDFISVQEYSTLPVTDPAAFDSTQVTTYQPAVLRSLKAGTGRVLVFENWALVDVTPFASRAAYVAALEASYATLLSKLSEPAALAPLSRAFEKVFEEKPQSYLFNPDGKHPNDAAIYLNACVYYALIYQDTPLGLPNLYLPAADAAYLQGIAARIVPQPAGGADAGTPADAGVPQDGGPAADGGAPVDGGAAQDGGTDAGALADAGTGDDAGASGDSAARPGPSLAVASAGSGGGCASAGAASNLLSLAAAAAYLARRAVRSSPATRQP